MITGGSRVTFERIGGKAVRSTVPADQQLVHVLTEGCGAELDGRL